MTVAVVGSRNWPEPQRIRNVLRALARKHPGVVIVSGGAKGADRTAESEARRLGLHVVSHRPQPQDGERYARAAKRRNSLIVRDSHYVIAFHVGAPWDAYRIDGTHGTADTIAKALRAGKPVARYLPGVREPEVYDERRVLAECEEFGEWI